MSLEKLEQRVEERKNESIGLDEYVGVLDSKDELKEYIRKEFLILEDRIYKGLARTMHNIKEVQLKQLHHMQNDVKRVDDKLNKLLELANVDIDIEELQRQKEIEELENRLKQLKSEV